MRLLLLGVLGAVFVGVCCIGCNRNRIADVDGGQSTKVTPTEVAASATLGARISTVLSRDPRLKDASITVGVSNLDGSVTLSGSARDLVQENLALRIARNQAKDAKITSRLSLQNSRPSVNKKVQPQKNSKR